MSQFRLINLVFTERPNIINEEHRHVWRNLGEHRSVVSTTDNFPMRDNLKALRAAKQQRAMTDNNRSATSWSLGRPRTTV